MPKKTRKEKIQIKNKKFSIFKMMNTQAILKINIFKIINNFNSNNNKWYMINNNSNIYSSSNNSLISNNYNNIKTKNKKYSKIPSLFLTMKLFNSSKIRLWTIKTIP